jgi:hypothetical protein
VLYQVKNCLKWSNKIAIRFINHDLSLTISESSKLLVLSISPTFERWLDTFVDKKLNWSFSRISWSIQKSEFTNFSKSVDEILHLEHHDVCSIVVSMQAQNL